MTDEIKSILFEALQTSFVHSVIIHKIDNENSAIEMDYESIADAIINALFENGYDIISFDEN